MQKKKPEKPAEILGSARLKAFKLIDSMLANAKNLEKLRKAFLASFEEDPVAFYKQFIKPTAEKEVLLTDGSDRPIAKVKLQYATEEEDREE